MQVRPLGGEDPPEKGMATHSDVLAWRIPWAERSSGLQSTGSGVTKNRTQLKGLSMKREGELHLGVC